MHDDICIVFFFSFLDVPHVTTIKLLVVEEEVLVLTICLERSPPAPSSDYPTT